MSARKLLLIVALFTFLTLAPFLLSPNPNPNHFLRIHHNSCLNFLHEIRFRYWKLVPLFRSISWQWDPSSPAVAPCGFRRLTRSEASKLLNGSSVLVAGDSQARLLTLALFRLLLEPGAVPAVETDLFRRHSDYHAEVSDGGVAVDFVWAPFEANLTALLQKLRGGTSKVPNVIVLGSGLWHMLHLTNSTKFGEGLDSIGLLSRELVPAPRLFWIGLPELISERLNTEAKRKRMNYTVWEEYDREIREWLVFSSPFLLLDMARLSRRCGPECTVDGMHYDGGVYEAALQIMLNALLIESE